MRIGEARNAQQLLQALLTTRDRRLMLRRAHEVIWWNNIALVAGDHYAQYNPNRALFEDRDPNFDTDYLDKKPRMVVNHPLAVARTELAKLTKSRPIMDVIANSNEPEDIAATKVGKSALDFAEWKFKMATKRKQAIWWKIVTGVGAHYVGWDYLDHAAGTIDFMVDPATGEATFSPVRQKEIQEMANRGEIDAIEHDSYPMGEVDLKVFSPFQLLPDETALDFEDIRDLITTEVVDVDELKGIYGKAAAHVNPEVPNLGVMEHRMMQRIGAVNPLIEARAENGAYVHSYWLEPDFYRNNSLLERGIFVRWCQGKLLDISSGFPFQDNRIPFTFYRHIPSATSIWPESTITQIRDQALEIDKTTSQLIESKDFMANPMWLVATQHKIKGQMKNVAGAIVRYVHVPNVPPPTPIQGLQMPAQVESLLAGLREQILDISGQSEVSRGSVPTGVRSGVAVAYLQEEDDTKLGPTVENMEQAIALTGSLILERFSQFYTTSRILRFYRHDGKFDAIKFKGTDLKNNTDVVVQAGSAMPKMKAARQQYTLELVSLGVLTDPKEIKEELDLGSGEPDNNDKAIAQADRENNIMLHGMSMGLFTLPQGASDEQVTSTVSAAVPVKAWQNHVLHIERHTSQMMDEEFDTLSITKPGIVRLFDEHVQQHQQFLAQQQQQQMQQQLAAKGAPEGVGGTPAGQQRVGGVGGTPPAAPQGPGPETRQITGVPDIIGHGETELNVRRPVRLR